MNFRIRPADPARDRAAMLSYIDGLQAFEYAVEKNRRLDAMVAAEHMAVLDKRLDEYGGAIFLAEDDGGPLGWAVVHETVDDIFVIESERRMAYIDELYLIERARGMGAGRVLIAACEDWAKGRGIGVIMIGVLAKNGRAHAIYNAAGYEDNSIQLRKYL
ncbi:MAG: GNAT family N-acetyltransferase [Alphaproteobacteria bacterium]|nr:GNAT family N-acetyltransferase [Alphaproteobacteria bacterium]MBL6936912.1 GNAT family N-acetyltransferase [Alphaproteobacteria bacterium]MBL7097681.1 GNAT family N-acetyltransferase [Alphaproteobacteria bacterium]